MLSKNLIAFVLLSALCSCTHQATVTLEHGTDESAGGGAAYIITTPSATYYLEKTGGGLSSMVDKDQLDWIGFHHKKGSAHKGEYRGFPNAVHKQDGSYFHAMNAGTDPSSSVVAFESENHIRIIFVSDNKKWEAQWDFYPDRCDFTMIKISLGYHYWVQYEGVPGGTMDTTDFWYASVDRTRHPIEEPFNGDLPYPEWMAFGDAASSRVLYLLHHRDDALPDHYIGRADMTVFGFGRQNGEKTSKLLTTVDKFSLGFVESTEYSEINRSILEVLE